MTITPQQRAQQMRQAAHRTRSLLAAEGITDNHALLAWLDGTRAILHAGAVELGVSAAEIEARLKKVNRGLIVGGMPAGYRARQVARPVGHASEALIAASKYLVTAGNRFLAVYMPELEEAGYRKRGGSGFTFKA